MRVVSLSANCNEIIDCFGMCGGDATEDCDGRCGGTLVKDCAYECGGSAYINDCGECVGGTTGRTDEFGKDVCGFCPGESTIEIDCNGDCGGTAVRDACQVCVGKLLHFPCPSFSIFKNSPFTMSC